jgi:hypothetical protein
MLSKEKVTGEELRCGGTGQEKKEYGWVGKELAGFFPTNAFSICIYFLMIYIMYIPLFLCYIKQMFDMNTKV